MSSAHAIRSTRGVLRDKASVQRWAAEFPEEAAMLRGKSLVYFNGAFSPPTRAHAYIAAAVCKDPEVDALWLDPEPARPGKERWQQETLAARVEMCERSIVEVGLTEAAGVGTLRNDLGPEMGTSPELFRVLRSLLGGPGEGKLIWALGADVFAGMKHWVSKAHACLQPGDTCDELLLFVRGEWTEQMLWAAARDVGHSPCHVRVMHMPRDLLGISSSFARRALVAADSQRSLNAECHRTMTPSVAEFCLARPDVCKIYREQVAVMAQEQLRTPEKTTSRSLKLEEPLLPGHGVEQGRRWIARL